MSLSNDLGLGKREVVAFVGAGGKSTLLLQLAKELVEDGRTVLLSTTTKMGTDQIPDAARQVDSVEEIDAGFAFLMGGIDGPKVLGVSGETVDRAHSMDLHEYVLVEADGARRRAIKAPNETEPVYPSSTSVVVYVIGLSSIGGQIDEVAHRAARVAALLDKSERDLVTPEDVARVATSEQGGMARLPEGARFVVALTGTGEGSAQIADAIETHPRVDRVVVSPGQPRPG